MTADEEYAKFLGRPLRNLSTAEVREALEDRQSAMAHAADDFIQLAIERLEKELADRAKYGVR